jgi:replication factor A1
MKPEVLLLGRQGSSELRVRDSILRLAYRYRLDPNDLLDSFIEAWKHGSTQQATYTITCRHSNAQSGMFQITHNQIISQFPIDLAVLTRPESFRHYFQEFKLEPKDPSQFYHTIDELRFRSRDINLKAKVVEIPSKRLVTTRWGAPASVSNVKIIDDTGSIRLSLWNHQIDTVSVGDEIDIQGCHVAKHMGNLQLRLGKKGTISINQGPVKSY